MQALLAQCRTIGVEMIHNTKCESIDHNNDDYQITTDSETFVAPNVFGCDGAYSFVRSQMPGAPALNYCGHITLGGVVRDYNPKQHILLGCGLTFLAFRCGAKDAYVILFQKMDEEAALTISKKSRAEQIKYFMGKAEQMDEMLPNIDPQIYFCLPANQLESVCATTESGINLLGDAAHTMTPMSGLATAAALDDVYHMFLSLQKEPSLGRAVAFYQEKFAGIGQKYLDYSRAKFLDPFMSQTAEGQAERLQKIRELGVREFMKGTVDLTQPMRFGLELPAGGGKKAAPNKQRVWQAKTKQSPGFVESQSQDKASADADTAGAQVAAAPGNVNH